MAQRLTVTLSDDREIVVTPTLVDRVVAETYFRNHPALGKMTDNPFRLLAFLAWSNAKRSGQIDVEWDQFLEGRDPNALHAIDVAPEAVEPEPEDDELGEATSPVAPGI